MFENHGNCFFRDYSSHLGTALSDSHVGLRCIDRKCSSAGQLCAELLPLYSPGSLTAHTYIFIPLYAVGASHITAVFANHGNRFDRYLRPLYICVYVHVCIMYLGLYTNAEISRFVLVPVKVATGRRYNRTRTLRASLVYIE